MTTEAELSQVALLFASHVVKKKLIQPGMLKKEKLISLYLQFQDEALNIPHIDGTDIIKALNDTCILKTRKATDNFVEFKDQIFGGASKEKISSMPQIRISKKQETETEQNGVSQSLYCDVCRQNFKDMFTLEQHAVSTIHKLKQQYRKARNKFIRNIPSLEISGFNEESCKNLNVNETKTCRVVFTNVAKEQTSFCFKNVYYLYELKGSQVEYERGKSIENDNTFIFDIIVTFNNCGAYIFPIVIEIEERSQGRKSVTHQLLFEPSFEVLSRDLNSLRPVELYKPLRLNKAEVNVFGDNLRIIPGEPLNDARNLLSVRTPLFNYSIPRSVLRIFHFKFKRCPQLDPEDAAILDRLKLLLVDSSAKKVLHNRDSLTTKNYTDRFLHLMWIEEYQMLKDMLLYKQNGVLLRLDERRNLFELKVPGLSEGRPSVLKGDKVVVKEYFAEIKFEGIVHVVEETSVFLAFDKKFKDSNVWKKKLEVQFILDRHTLKLCYRALHQVQKRSAAPLLFPALTKKEEIPFKDGFLRPFFNEGINHNEEQQRAIFNIVKNSAFPAPYILFGPPGTGKTATVVEAISQMWSIYGRGKKICVCAPSNSAADLITERLLRNIPAYEILRIYATSRFENDIPHALKKCSNFDRMTKELFFPSKEQIKLKTIVVMTPMTAGRLVSGGFKGGHFSYLFMDEAGHAIEPEMMVPIIGLLTKDRGSKKLEFRGSLVLAGDPKQLGPVIRSSLAVKLGLDMSLLERLMDQCNPYARDKYTLKYNSRYITKLVKNYRSHKVILRVPNLLFYDNELEESGPVEKINSAGQWMKLQALRNDFPLLFHCVQGKEEREGNSPSYFNRFEIDVVGQYVRQLVNRNFGRHVVQEKDIGIITPYRKQVQKLKQYLQEKGQSEITVASVEEFQGQERLIIIITTVRSRFELVESDYQFGLGFLDNAKRFNVAVTRAIALLIVIGNPDILQCDPNWRKLIQYCVENNSYVGDPPSGNLPPDFHPVKRSMDLEGLIDNADNIPADEKPGFRTDL